MTLRTFLFGALALVMRLLEPAAGKDAALDQSLAPSQFHCRSMRSARWSWA